MTIYTSSFNQKPEKPKKEKPVKVKPEKIKKEKPIKTKKTNKALVCLIVFCALFALCIFPNIFKNVILGLFGLSVYPVCLIGIFFSFMFTKKRKYNAKKKYIVYLTCTLFTIWFVFHLILTSKIPTNSYWEYLKLTYLAKTTAGGMLFSLLSYPAIKVLTVVGAYIFSAIALAIFVGLIIDYVNVQRHLEENKQKSAFVFDDFQNFDFDQDNETLVVEKEEPVKVVEENPKQKLAKQKLGLEKSETTIISSSMPNYDINLRQEKPLSKREYILTPLDPIIPIETEPLNKPFEQQRIQKSNINFNDFIKTKNVEEIKASNLNFTEKQFEPEEKITINSEPETSLQSQELDNETDDLFVESEDLNDYETAFETTSEIEEETTENAGEINEITETYEEELEELEDLNEEYEESEDEVEDTSSEIEEITPDLEKEEFVDEYSTSTHQTDLGSTVATEVVRPSIDISKFNLPNKITNTVGEQKEETPVAPQKLDIPPYVAPPVELLNYIDNVYKISEEELQDNIERLEQVLEDFKVPAKVNNVKVGPAVTRYELTMPRGISVNKIAQMSDDIAMTLASNGAIRVEAPIPGKNSVGVEVPNAQVSSVSLRELIDSEQFRLRGNPLSFVLGKDINGDIIFCNLDKMPHVLVAGSTGSGKSVCLNTMLLSMCYKAGPEDLRLILVDPKMVEFSTYNGLPHLLIPEVITNKDMTINALDWCIKEMERRYSMFAKNHVVNINEYNKLEMVKNKREPKLPFIVIVVDELADLMLEAKREIEDRISKLAAKARASGINLVLATQRPSVDVITGTVKTNLPSRIAFALTNYMDSKTVIDGGGAEKLLGKGDMLFKPQDKNEPSRVQGAYVSNPEISAVVQFIKDHNNPVYDDNAGNAIKNPHHANKTDVSGAKEMEFDPVLKEALKWFIQMKQASGSMISRRYSVGFNRAGRIMDQMEQAGFIGPQEGSKPRQVLITMDEYNAIFGE